MAATDTTRIQINSSNVISRNVQNGSVFQEYPPSRPFIHDDYRRDVTKPIIAYPESNRHGMICLFCNVSWVGCISQLVECRSLASELSLSCTRLAADG